MSKNGFIVVLTNGRHLIADNVLTSESDDLLLTGKVSYIQEKKDEKTGKISVEIIPYEEIYPNIFHQEDGGIQITIMKSCVLMMFQIQIEHLLTKKPIEDSKNDKKD